MRTCCIPTEQHQQQQRSRTRPQGQVHKQTQQHDDPRVTALPNSAMHSVLFQLVVVSLLVLFGLDVTRSGVHVNAFHFLPIHRHVVDTRRSLRSKVTCFTSLHAQSSNSNSNQQTSSLRATTTTPSTKTDQVFDADKMELLEVAKHRAELRRSRASANDSNKDDVEWTFIDTARIHVAAGNGGNGCVAFRREKGVARGGPAGGRGGRGGCVYLVCDPTINTLVSSVRQQVHWRAQPGTNGTGKNRDGGQGQDMIIRVPPGTLIRDLATQKLAGELRDDGEMLLVAKGGRGGRGNAAFMTARRTAPKLAERGETGAARWLSLELRLVADVGFLGKPNAGKSTLLAAASAARPKIASYPFTTTIPNLGVCDLGLGTGLVLCDIPGLIEGAARGAGMGGAFLRHVQRCRVLLHLLDGAADDPIADFHAINTELELYDPFLAQKPQVVVINKMDIPDVAARADSLVQQLKQVAGHTRVMTISAATTNGVQELMGRLRKFVLSQPEPELPPPPEIDLSKAGLDYDSDDYEIQSDPAYPGQWRVAGLHIEQIARMTHWEYPEAIERFGRQLTALGISAALQQRGAQEGDLVMIDQYDFDFTPGMTNPYLPDGLLRDDDKLESGRRVASKQDEVKWRPYSEGGFLDEDIPELVGFNAFGDWDLLEDANDETDKNDFDDDEVWTSS